MTSTTTMSTTSTSTTSTTAAIPAGGKPRILTGDTPTSTGLHLGHFVGSLENRLALQDAYDCYFLIANVHAFTTLSEKTADIRANTLGIVKDWLAVGLDPERSTFVLQSEIPAIAELTFLFAMLLPFNKVMRNPTLKTEIESKNLGDHYSFGFPMYAVGQCADILTFRPELVPVGEDQEAHIEMCRDVALKFNQLYCGVGNRVLPEDHAKSGGVFPVPRAKIGRIARLVGTDGKNKMSKSLNNAIFLYDEPKAVQKKINGIVTGRASSTSPIDLANPLIQYVEAFLPAERAEQIKSDYSSGKEVMDGHIKAEVGAAINALLAPMRERRAKLEAPPAPGSVAGTTSAGGEAIVLDVIQRGIKKANAVAEETLYAAKQAMKLDFGVRVVG
ncbi:MAG: tryptophan--tRNA ligase [Planctomycetota bacterium]|nr:tryptophan--tRNA ligase [Planctomycetota bacterium]